MKRKSEVELDVIARVLFTGASAYLFVQYLLLPQLLLMNLSFTAYFYTGVAVSGILAIAIALMTRPAKAAPDMFPAE
ncbi:hypothetical protein [Gymnodinialimonas sp. 57CJ19]|uniref:hypothetical protein n=1 Tax=Gymnodinialimonas sp. 57CJ19 TaxID=3138498 RepID=UPI003134432B